jgi:DMSO/TMAO reductase YedYZ molybdopterin-dependent catalytic subunit/ferredoxin-NADP reductase
VISRGFTGRGGTVNPRLPPGQYAERGFPVMSVAPTPTVRTTTWRFTITTETGEERSWDWDQFRSLPADDITTDLHCVTNWSKLDTKWRGVSLDTLLGDLDTSATYVMAEGADGYTANLPLADLRGGQAWIVYSYDGGPIAPEHGGPARLLIPHLYLWKSAKWLTGLRLMREDERGFWEDLGYHDYGDPWREQRYRELSWQVATVLAVRDETASARTLVLDVPAWTGHLPGQHVDVRLRNADGYTAQRSYSIASAPEPWPEPEWPVIESSVLESSVVELTVQRIADGEVSPYLAEIARPGDQFEICGPIGGGFTWDPEESHDPLLLIAGGSGIVPVMAMIRANEKVPARLIYSVRTPADIIYAGELSERSVDSPLEVTYRFTRSAPPGFSAGRINADLLAAVGFPPEDNPSIYICGPVAFVESASSFLIAVGHPASAIKTERFGPTT